MKTQVVIETPKGSREKYHYDPDVAHYVLKKLLPLGMVFPYDFGFIPGTSGEDGDPLDAMVISEFSSFPGCRINARLIGGLTATQTEKHKKVRNDRFFFIPVDSVLYKHIKSISEFSNTHNGQLVEFFVSYNKVEGKVFQPGAIISPAQAEKIIEKYKRE